EKGNELGESESEAKDERGHQDQDEEHDGGVVDDLGPRGPRDLTHLFANLAKKLTGSGAIAATTLDVLRGGAARRSGAVGAHLSLSLHQSLLFAVHLTSLVRTSLRQSKTIFQQGRRDSNPQPPVLETGALPIEPLPSGATRHEVDVSLGTSIVPPRPRIPSSGSLCAGCAYAPTGSTSS